MACRRLFSAAVLAALACGEGSGPSGITFKEASTLASELEPIARALSIPQLRSLSGLAIPINRHGLDVHNMETSLLGRTIEWAPVLREVIYTDRTGAPAGAIRLILYTTDSTSRPAYPLEELGYVDMYPHNTFNGGGPDSMSLRFIVTDTRTTPVVVADFIAHSHDTTCQCATVEGWAQSGAARVDFRSAYNIPLGGDGRFPGELITGALGFEHFATLPGPGVSTATATLALGFAGDSIALTSGLLRPHGGRLEGTMEVTVNGKLVAAVTRSASGTRAVGEHRSFTGAERRVLEALFSIPADLAYYIEWPTFVIFFCGC